jgi:hypothetical protein
LDYVYSLRIDFMTTNEQDRKNLNLTQCWNIKIFHSPPRKKVRTYPWIQIIDLEDDEKNAYLNEVGHGNDEKP